MNETLAKRSFPNVGPSGANQDELYMPYYQHPFYANELQVAVRAKGDPRPLARLVREIAARRNPDIAVNSITIESMLEESVAAPRFRPQLLLAIAGLALVLAAAGLYGVLAYLVSQRLSEFGLRVDLGAQSGDIVALVWREAGMILSLGFADLVA